MRDCKVETRPEKVLSGILVERIDMFTGEEYVHDMFDLDPIQTTIFSGRVLWKEEFYGRILSSYYGLMTFEDMAYEILPQLKRAWKAYKKIARKHSRKIDKE